MRWLPFILTVVVILLMKALIPGPRETQLKISRQFREMSRLPGSKGFKSPDAADKFRAAMADNGDRFEGSAGTFMRDSTEQRFRKAMAGPWWRKALWRLSYWGP